MVDESVYNVDGAKRGPMSNTDVPAKRLRTIDLDVVSAHAVAHAEPSLDFHGTAHWSALLLPPKLASHRLHRPQEPSVYLPGMTKHAILSGQPIHD
jgi:hypothetical protein